MDKILLDLGNIFVNLNYFLLALDEILLDFKTIVKHFDGVEQYL